jgi:serine phosphatase RsbU (regulator of sigma subunit)
MFTIFFRSLKYNELVGGVAVGHQLYYFILGLIILYESLRLSKVSYILATVYSIIIITYDSIYFPPFALLPDTLKFYAPWTFISFISFLGFSINLIKRKSEFYLAEFLAEKKVLDKDMKLAHFVQESLFPRRTEIKGLQYEVFRKTQNQIGGDFYDFIQLREGNVGIFITDVSGHGISSAMVASMIKVMISTLPYHLKLKPSEMLTYIDKQLSSQFSEHHASAMYIFVDFQTGKISLANAGHPYCIYAKKGEEFKEIVTRGSLLGFKLSDPIAETINFNYNKGDKFIIYTDGIVETPSPTGKMIGPEGIIHILNQHKDIESLPDLRMKILSEISQFNGSVNFSDDAMFLIFELQ